MEEQGISEEMVRLTLDQPTHVVDGYSSRKIYQRRLNGHVLRVIVEEDVEIKRVVTAYIAGGVRYEV